MTRLNASNDRGMGRGAKIVPGAVRDSLHMAGVVFGLDGGELPEIAVSDEGPYSDVVFGLLELLGISHRPALAGLPGQKDWRISSHRRPRAPARRGRRAHPHAAGRPRAAPLPEHAARRPASRLNQTAHRVRVRITPHAQKAAGLGRAPATGPGSPSPGRSST
jgi:hypothetical protein